MSDESAHERHASLVFRPVTERDHARVVGAIPEWWQTPNSEALPLLLPRLFFQHFSDTSTIVEDGDGRLAAFLVGFRSQSQPEVGYVHFVGVRPDLRGAGLARSLYERFFAQVRALGCRRVDAITGPDNMRSQEFHRAMGFTIGGDTDVDGVLAYLDYDGLGEHRVTFTRVI
ncbi:GNAT family N-acetyltransferase [Agromyces humatus]|uniref:GNAT family N-acetyltransferase n=1 Tax=Agromyces humatus TaxID=279573 RepID=A0ABN2KLM3_9MICO|nr:GNAT family N-acetyltransferase [Agromyces humatus]